jgi:hypothetical protein
MRTVRFSTVLPYQIPANQPGARPQPVLEVRISSGPGTSPKILALVDSGAEVSAFHVDLAALAGVNLTSCRPVAARGVGGTTAGYACAVELEIEGRRFAAGVYFVPTVVALLGRHDVFAHFLFGFDQRAGELLIEPYP